MGTRMLERLRDGSTRLGFVFLVSIWLRVESSSNGVG